MCLGLGEEKWKEGVCQSKGVEKMRIKDVGPC